MMKKTVKNEFLFFFFHTNPWIIQGSTIKRLYNRNLKDINIPIPSIGVQEKIVEKLKKLYYLSNDVNDGMPREIGLRKEQYEYYRNLLLKFDNYHG